MRKNLAIGVMSVLLGMASHWMAAIDDGPALRAWLQWLPVQVDQVFLPEGKWWMLLLAMVALTSQYVVVFALIQPALTFIQSLLTFMDTVMRGDIAVKTAASGARTTLPVLGEAQMFCSLAKWTVSVDGTRESQKNEP